jgi:SAM-dependent methyltransferase
MGSFEYTSPPAFDRGLECSSCGFDLVHQRGIWLALAAHRKSHYERFMAEYQLVRADEQRGSKDAAFYLALPYRDLSKANQHQWQIRARTFDYLDSMIFATATGLKVLDIGAGNGWLSYRLALRGHMPVAVDLQVNDFDGLGAASHYLERLPSLFPRFQAEMNRLPFSDDQFDCAIFNASFHYSEDYVHTLGEVIRCVRSGGRVVIADTPWYSRAESGEQMVAERHAQFSERFGFPSDGLASLEYLTDDRLEALERWFGLKWEVHKPDYGVRWAMRPWIAKFKGRREPSQFRIYVAEVAKQ